MKLAMKTEKGPVRSSNQDAVNCGTWSEQEVWAVVCDGMGGANGGNVASSVCVERISAALEHFPHGAQEVDVQKFLYTALFNANRAVYEMSCQDAELEGMGTTADLVLVKNSMAYIVHVGDSRVYKISPKGIVQVTSDHTYVQSLLDAGTISPEEAEIHPQKHMITRAIGVEPLVDIDFYEEEMNKGTSLLLCSDGLSNLVSTELMQEYVTLYPPKEAVELLVQKAVELGGFDNVTVAIISNVVAE